MMDKVYSIKLLFELLFKIDMTLKTLKTVLNFNYTEESLSLGLEWHKKILE